MISNQAGLFLVTGGPRSYAEEHDKRIENHSGNVARGQIRGQEVQHADLL